MGAKANLLIYMKKKNIKKPEFYKITGLSNGFLDKNDGITSGTLETIVENFSDLSLEWLITGRGEMLKNSQNNNNISQSIVGDNNVQAGNNNSIVGSNVIGNNSRIGGNISISGENNSFNPNDIAYFQQALAQKDEALAQKDKQISELYSKILELNEKIINLISNK